MQRNAPRGPLVEMLLDLDDEWERAVPFDDNRVVNWRQGSGEPDVDHRAMNGDHLADRELGARHRRRDCNGRTRSHRARPDRASAHVRDREPHPGVDRDRTAFEHDHWIEIELDDLGRQLDERGHAEQHVDQRRTIDPR